jgi:hypothetical protein
VTTISHTEYTFRLEVDGKPKIHIISALSEQNAFDAEEHFGCNRSIHFDLHALEKQEREATSRPHSNWPTFMGCQWMRLGPSVPTADEGNRG